MESRSYCEYCRAFYDVAAAVNSSLEPTAVLDAIVQKGAAATGAKGCAIMLLTADRTELRHSANHGLSDWYVGKGPVRMDPDMAEALEGRAVAVTDAGSDPRVQYQAEAVREGIVSMLSVPIRLRGEVIGVMRMYTAEPREFGDEDIEFVEAIANLGAIALDNARRHVQSRVDLEALQAYIYRYGGA